MSALNILLTSCTIILITSREWAFGQNFVHCSSVHLHFIKVAKENWSHHSSRSYTNDEMLILELFRRRVFIVEFWLFGFHAWVHCLWVPLIRNSYKLWFHSDKKPHAGYASSLSASFAAFFLDVTKFTGSGLQLY